MTRISPFVFLLAGIIPVSTLSVSQVASEPVSFEITSIEKEISPHLQKLNKLALQFPNSRLQKRFTSRGKTRLLIEHFDKPLKIIAFDDGKFEVRITREFSADDIDGLADNHPELLKFAAAFPKQVDNGTVNLKIETEVTLHLENESKFESGHPELCNIYRAFKDAPLQVANASSISQLLTSFHL